jgi:hypothetical protein
MDDMAVARLTFICSCLPRTGFHEFPLNFHLTPPQVAATESEIVKETMALVKGSLFVEVVR